MIKQLVAFALAAGVSMSASAGFIQYNMNNVTIGQHGQLDGFFIQDTSDNSIAYYQFQNGTDDGPSSDFNTLWGWACCSSILSAEYNAFGPTNFRFSNQGDIHNEWSHDVQLTFTKDALTGAILVNGSMDLWWVNENGEVDPYPGLMRDIHGGTLVQGEVDAALLARLESGQTFVNRVVPSGQPVPVPEPGSLALLLAGVWAIARLRRESWNR